MNIRVVNLKCKRLNASAGPEVEAQIKAAWASGATVITLDFSEVATIDSLGVSVLVAAHRRRPPGARILFCSLNHYVREVLEITQLVKLFDVYADADAALKTAS